MVIAARRTQRAYEFAENVWICFKFLFIEFYVLNKKLYFFIHYTLAKFDAPSKCATLSFQSNKFNAIQIPIPIYTNLIKFIFSTEYTVCLTTQYVTGTHIKSALRIYNTPRAISLPNVRKHFVHRARSLVK